jgi:hypothetical protein
MESSGVPGRIHVSDSTRNSALKTNQSFEFTDRGVSKIEAYLLAYLINIKIV